MHTPDLRIFPHYFSDGSEVMNAIREGVQNDRKGKWKIVKFRAQTANTIVIKYQTQKHYYNGYLNIRPQRYMGNSRNLFIEVSHFTPSEAPEVYSDEVKYLTSKFVEFLSVHCKRYIRHLSWAYEYEVSAMGLLGNFPVVMLEINSAYIYDNIPRIIEEVVWNSKIYKDHLRHLVKLKISGTTSQQFLEFPLIKKATLRRRSLVIYYILRLMDLIRSTRAIRLSFIQFLSPV